MQALNYVFIDSGAMYRAVTLKALRNKVDPTDETRVADIARSIRIELKPHPERTLIFVDGEDASAAIRTEEIAKGAFVSLFLCDATLIACTCV